jgi:hypothetical protein
MIEKDFVTIDVQNIFSRILTDVLERTQGIPEASEQLLWDNCVANESSDGLVTMLSKAMAGKHDLFLVYDKAVKLIRKADPKEESQIRKDYKDRGESVVGTYITFKNYTRSDMVRLYSALEYCAVAALSKSMNLSKAIQLKLSDLRSSVGLTDSADVKAQALKIAEGLQNGKDVMLDAKDTIETSAPDLTATKSAMEFIAQKRSFYLGLPATYITGESSKGLGDSGVGDAKAVERGLKNYYFSVIKPVSEALFGVKTTFKSEDFDGLSTSLEALKTFELTSDELISQDNKRVIINKLFGLPENEKGDEPKELAPPPVAQSQLPPPPKTEPVAE